MGKLKIIYHFPNDEDVVEEVEIIRATIHYHWNKEKGDVEVEIKASSGVDRCTQ